MRASGIYGDRDVGAVTLPLGMLMRPMEMVSPAGDFVFFRLRYKSR